MDKDDFDAAVDAIVSAEKSLNEQMEALEKEYPQVFEKLKKLENAGKEVEALKSKLKSDLLEAEDFDVHDENSKVRVSLTRIPKVAVADIEKVPADFKETKVVANDKKATEYLRVMGVVPDGFVDKSYHRFNWIVKEKNDG